MEASETEDQQPIQERLLSEVSSKLEPAIEGPARKILFSADRERSEFLATLKRILEKEPWPKDNPNALNDIMDITTRGVLRDHAILPVGTWVHDEAKDELFFETLPTALPPRGHQEYRLALAAIYLRDPELAEAIVANKIIGLHGAPSGTLLSILEKGLMPLQTLRDESIEVVSGARDAHSEERTRISFLPVSYHTAHSIKRFWGDGQPITSEKLREKIDGVAADLRRLRGLPDQNDTVHEEIERSQSNLLELQNLRNHISYPEVQVHPSLEDELIVQNFPLVFGFAGEGLEHSSIMDLHSDTSGEHAVKDVIKPSNIRLVFAPAEKVEYVQRIAEARNPATKVFPIEDLTILENPARPVAG